MKKYEEIVTLYREIACALRVWGAEKVIMLNSRMQTNESKEMMMEIAVEGAVDKEILEQKSQQKWENLEIDITVINELADRELVNEIYEDGILL